MIFTVVLCVGVCAVATMLLHQLVGLYIVVQYILTTALLRLGACGPSTPFVWGKYDRASCHMGLLRTQVSQPGRLLGCCWRV